MATVEAIYTDGACSGNPGPGGWGTRIEFADGQVHELGGRDAATTNNRMEMQAAIAALEFLSQDDLISGPVILHTDSEYLKNGITKWIKGWKRKGWKTSTGKAVLNKDLWQQLDLLTQTLTEHQLNIDWRYVRGHTGNAGNERCDQIARAFSHAQPITLKQHTPSASTASDTASSDEASPHQPDGQKESSLSNPEINDPITQEASSEPALKSYESDSQEGNRLMTAQSEKNIGNPESTRVDRLKNALKTLQVTDELAKQGYLITSAELADLMDVNASAVTSRGDYWAWRNWTVSRIRREGNQILWQLERIDE
ncbi:ribonuclease HI [Leptolyngbya sp. BC1307]|uniref:ribonuclease HI n=1 Tax=Leptolyngbya sp. BC1307 TaxID=2029589 RepID=UPI000EFC880E|nr:ribonuclease HI [Leptolyngbya sp. BC1307]